ncbi:MAG TPA: DUF4149 domain-containing protein [Longimicrobiales bacterium]|nr:DUF4149 domain-containing protein [Longimicrobiales bacterium]
MAPLHFLNLALHVLAAIAWLGGMFFFALFGAPVLRTVEPASLRSSLFQALGRRFRWIGWALVAILLATGMVNLSFLGLLSAEVLGSPEFWGTPVGTALGWKLIGVGAMIVLGALHDFVWGPRSGRHLVDSAEGRRARQVTSWIGRVNALVGIVVVLAAIRLARGG